MSSYACPCCGKGPFGSLRAVTGHANWCRKRTPEFATRRMLSMRADLLRVARMKNVPEGYGPSQLAYRDHGRYSEKLIIGWFTGYTKAGNPCGNWRTALAKLGFKLYGDYYHASPDRVAADLRRVALMIGRPGWIPPRNVYLKLGRWDPCTVYHHMRVKTWGEVAERLALKRNRPFPSPSENERDEAA